MKKSFISFLFLISVLSIAFANSITKGVLAMEGTSLSVDFEDEAEGFITVSIKDMAGVVLYEELVNTDMTKQKVYNLKNLPDGKYVVERNKKLTKVSQFFTIDKDQVVLLEEKVLYKPVTKFEDNLWSLNLLNMGEKTSVHIREKGGSEIYTEQFDAPSIIAKRYNLDKLLRGTYVIDVFVGDELFKETVVVR